MGIKHMFPWLVKNFPNIITKYFKNAQMNMSNLNIHTFLIDLNGIIHTSAQKAFEYGQFKKENSQLSIESYNICIQNLHQFVLNDIIYLTKFVKPQKRLVICIDGCAPISKQNQQRQRRFRGKVSFDENCLSIPVKPDCIFDSNAITPGTEFMENLSTFLNFELSKLSKQLNLEIVFSPASVPGEGEHNCLDFERRYGGENKIFCIHGVDADLIMLTLGAKTPFYVLRNEMYDSRVEFNLVNISMLKECLKTKNMNVDGVNSNVNIIDNVNVINFITICFLVGNDFLPNVPFIEVSQGSIDKMMKFCNEQLIDNSPSFLTINKMNCAMFFKKCAEEEEKNFTNRYLSRANWLYSEILEKSNGNFELYKQLYYEQCHEKIPNLVKEYIKGIEWVINYYINGVPDWQWKYPYHYAPFASDIYNYINQYESTNWELHSPTKPFVQLLSVLPKESSCLLPEKLQHIFYSDNLKEYFPERFRVDYANCKKEWEGHVILPAMNYDKLQDEYKDFLKQLSKEELNRNEIKKPIVFKPDGTCVPIKM